MSVTSVLESWFVTFEQVSVGGMRGQKFICELHNGKRLFVKVREKERWDWFEWGLRKEHFVCAEIGQNISDVPRSPFLSFFEEKTSGLDPERNSH